MHILLRRRHDQRMEDDVLGRFSKQCAGGVHVDWCALDQRFIPLLWILPGRVPDEAGTQCLSDPHRVPTARDDFMVIPTHDHFQLRVHVFRALHAPRLYKVVEAPGIRKGRAFPCVVDVQ